MRRTEIDADERKLHELSRGEARLVLENFLKVEREALNNAEVRSSIPVLLDYTRDSVVGFFRHGIFGVIGTSPKVDLYSPEFRRDEARVVWLSRMAYYFGESLVRSANKLRWDVGNEETATANHPVVAGFPNAVEAAVIMISRSLTARVLMDGAPIEAVTKAVDYWFELARNV